MELRRYAGVLLSWWWLLALAMLVAGGLSWYISQSLPKVYRASVILLVNQARDTTAPDYNSVLLSERLARTYADLIRRPPVLHATIEKLQLPYDTQRLTEQLDVRVVRDTQLLEVAVEDEDPARARDVANTIAEVFIAQRAADQAGATTFSRAALQQQIRKLEAELRQTSEQLDQAKRAGQPSSAEVTRLQTLLAEQQTTYSQLLRSEVDMALAEARATNALRVAAPAELPLEPVRPRVLLNTALAAVIGLLLALGVVFLLEYLDDTVKAGDDVLAVADLPTLATIPRVPGRSPAEPFLLGEGDTHPAAEEAYRILRVNLEFAWATQPGKVIMLSSANPSEGKSTTTANLGLVLAEAGRRVVVVDADLRRPSLHRVFAVDGRRGLTTLLISSDANAASYLVPTRHPNLFLLPGGPVPPNPSELLGSDRFAQVLEQLRQAADVVLIDTAPLLAVADPAVVGRLADGTILVVEAASTRRDALARAAEVLARSATHRLGVVLNKLSPRAPGYGYYYQGYYQVDGVDRATVVRRGKAAGA